MELMVVVLIIVILIAILVPAVGSVNTTAKKTATAALMNQLATAAQQFQIDNRRIPGYFSAAEMGSVTNNPRGFTAMENIMLDLAGGIVPPGSPPPPAAAGPGTRIVVGPGPAAIPERQVTVETTLIGASTGSIGGKGHYFVPDKKYFVVQRVAPLNANPTVADRAKKDCPQGGDHYKLPDVVDAFGTPLLAWVEDDSPANDRVFVENQLNGNDRASFYWMSNAAFLRASSLGKMGKDQRLVGDYVNSDAAFSLIGSRGGLGGGMPDQAVRMLEALLGNPAYPDPDPVSGAPLSVPASPRGSMVFHSAGGDGYYLGSRDTGGKIARGLIGAGSSPYNPNAADGKPPSEDLMSRCDDGVVTGGN